jgi:hypothetical protein
MKKYLVISLVFFTFWSCKTYPVEGEFISKATGETLIIPFFNETGYEYLYSGKISAYGKSFNGILVVKKISDSEKRIALVSDFGNTMIDLVVKNGKSEVNYILDDLNKAIIRNKLKKYFELLVNSEYTTESVYKSADKNIFTSEFQSKQVIIYENNASLVEKVKQVSRTKKKVEIMFYSKANYADSIHFKSHEIPFEMKYYKR